MTDVLHILAAFGLLYIIPLTYRFLNFTWIYLLRPSSVRKYLHGQQPYTLITGSTDGIGKALAKQLYQRGFNLILHGRNEDKMKQAVQELKASGTGDIRYFIADAAKDGHDFQALVQPFKDLNITLLVNNVGGTPVKHSKIETWEQDEVASVVRRNGLFTLHLTRALLPQMRRAKGPVLVIGIGSQAGEVPPPRLPLYVSSKRFVEYLFWGLQVDEWYYTKTNVELMYMVVGEVTSNSVRKDTTLLRPDSDTFARSMVNTMGCGQRRITPYIWHAISMWFVQAFGENVSVPIVAEAMRNLWPEAGKKQD